MSVLNFLLHRHAKLDAPDVTCEILSAEMLSQQVISYIDANSEKQRIWHDSASFILSETSNGGMRISKCCNKSGEPTSQQSMTPLMREVVCSRALQAPQCICHPIGKRNCNHRGFLAQWQYALGLTGFGSRIRLSRHSFPYPFPICGQPKG